MNTQRRSRVSFPPDCILGDHLQNIEGFTNETIMRKKPYTVCGAKCFGYVVESINT